MRRTITVIAAAVAAMFSAGIANAAVDSVPAVVPEGLKVVEVATAYGPGPNAQRQEFIKLQNTLEMDRVSISGVKVFVTVPGQPALQVAQIPFGTRKLAPGQTFLLATPGFEPQGAVPDLVFSTQTDNIPNIARINLRKGTATFDTANISQAAALTPQDIKERKTLHRTQCIAPAWAKYGATPRTPEKLICF